LGWIVKVTHLDRLLLIHKIQIVSQAEYLPLRKALLDKEKANTRERDALARERRSLPVVEVTTPYRFTAALDDSSEGKKQVTLLDLFDGRAQLIVYHFMFAPEWDAGCSSCSMVGDSIPRDLSHLHARDVSFVAVSRAPIDQIVAYKKRMGWTFPWVSSYGTEFNYDFGVTQDESVRPISYNFKSKADLQAKGENWFMNGEQPGHSIFIIGEGNKVYHTYSTYARGGDPVINTFVWLDMTLRGRQDDKSAEVGLGFKRHDEYTDDDLKGFSHQQRQQGGEVKVGSS
jgi:predicted dithiol-disulfide oxidoreductase (DUF899 family)